MVGVSSAVLGGVALVASWLLAAGTARADAPAGPEGAADSAAAPTARVEHPAEVGAVIPEGQDQLLGDMLGMGTTLPGGCAFTDGKVDRRTVTASYACSAGTLAIVLHHPNDAPAGAVQTAKFAIAVQSGTVPDGFIDALTARIRAKEPAFQWQIYAPPASTTVGTGPRLWWLAVVAIVVVVLVWAVRRRAGRRAADYQ
jgi:hypothetical protein